MILVQTVLTVLLVGPLLWGSYNLIRYKGTPAPRVRAYYITMINSGVLYALAFNIIFFLQELFLVIGKKVLGLESILYHNNHTWVGEHEMVLLMQGSGALAIFLIGLICLAIFQFFGNSKSLWKLFLFWMAFNGLIQSIPQVMIGYLDPGTDVGEALVGYLNLSEPVLIFLAVTSLIATIILSIWFSRLLLEFAMKDTIVSGPKAKLKYIRFIAVGAAIIGSILVVPFRILPISQVIAPFAVFVFSIPWTWAAAARSLPKKRNPNKVNEKIYWSPIVCLALLLAFFRLFLAPGITF